MFILYYHKFLSTADNRSVHVTWYAAKCAHYIYIIIVCMFADQQGSDRSLRDGSEIHNSEAWMSLNVVTSKYFDIAA